MTKYIFVTGGVVSGLGKGITAASTRMKFMSFLPPKTETTASDSPFLSMP